MGHYENNLTNVRIPSKVNDQKKKKNRKPEAHRGTKDTCLPLQWTRVVRRAENTFIFQAIWIVCIQVRKSRGKN